MSVKANKVENSTHALLENSELRYRRLFEAAQDGILILDAETGMIEDVNPYLIKMLGYSREEFLKKNLWEVGAFKDVEASKDAFQALQKIEYIRYEDLPLKTKDGLLIEVEFVSNVYIVGNLKVIQCNIRDITARRQAERHIQTILADEKDRLTFRVDERTADLSLANMDLALALRAKDEFLASMSHELRTPLTSILGFSEALQLETYGELNVRQQRTIRMIEDSGHHLLDLINDILDLTKIEVGKFELEFAPCSIGDICQASLQLTKGMAQQKHQLVHYSAPAGPFIVRGDARRLKQILVNLLSNAIKFSTEYAELGLEVQPNETEKVIRLIVWDRGIGIGAEDMGKLFTPFFQIDNSLARQYSGTGLGLSLVKRLTELHNGGVALESKFGEGSRFTIILPWSSGDTAPALFSYTGDIPRNTAIPLHSSNQPTILIAEDNEMVLQMISDFLESRLYQVIKTRSGFELLKRAAEFQPDLMLVDIQMPGMDGLETIRRIRSRADLQIAATPLIAITALAMHGDRERCLLAGADEYISKPVKLLELAAIMEKLIRKRNE